MPIFQLEGCQCKESEKGRATEVSRITWSTGTARLQCSNSRSFYTPHGYPGPGYFIRTNRQLQVGVVVSRFSLSEYAIAITTATSICYRMSIQTAQATSLIRRYISRSPGPCSPSPPAITTPPTCFTTCMESLSDDTKCVWALETIHVLSFI